MPYLRTKPPGWTPGFGGGGGGGGGGVIITKFDKLGKRIFGNLKQIPLISPYIRIGISKLYWTTPLGDPAVPPIRGSSVLIFCVFMSDYYQIYYPHIWAWKECSLAGLASQLV